MAALCALGLASAVLDGRRVWTTPESRTVAIHRAAEILKQPGFQGERVGVAEELRVHDADLRRLGAPYEVASWLDLVCGGADEHDLIVSARSFRPDLPMQNEFTAIMDTLRPPGMTPIEAIGPEHGVHLHWPSKNPGVVLMARTGATQTSAAGTDPPPADADPACRRLSWSLAVETDEPTATPPVVLPAGRHILAWRAQADGFRHGRADYRVVLNETIAGTLMRPVEERTLQAAMESSIHLLPVTLEADRKLALQFELSPDPAGRTDSSRGSVYLESFLVLSPKGP